MNEITKAMLDLLNHIQINHKSELDQYNEPSLGISPARTVSEFFVLKKIGDQGTINASALAESLNISKSGISKITGRFADRGLITAAKREGNEKEIFYSLTDFGKEAYTSIIKSGKEKMVKMEDIAAQFTDDEQKAIHKYLTVIKTILY